jgi:hypothetical protein
MKMKRILNKFGLAVIVVALVFQTSCEKLEVENLNEPNLEDVLASPDDVKTLIGSQFLSYWQAIKQYNIGMTAQVTADQTTVSWGNFAWRVQSWEPRQAWDNSPSYVDADMTTEIFFPLYSVISSANDALKLIDDGMQIGTNGADNNLVYATALLIRGMCFGQLGITFDKVQIPLHTSDLSSLTFEPYNVVIEAAVDDLLAAVAIFNANEFAWGPSAINGITVDQTFMKQLAYSHAARFLTLGARTKAENDNMSWTTRFGWADVLTFTNSGLTQDFAPVGQGLPWDGGVWWDLNIKYLRQPGWGRVDCRVVNILDPDYPVRYPTDAAGLATLGAPNPHGTPGVAISADARLASDFEFLASNDFRPERGGWHFSHYRIKRYDYPSEHPDAGAGESRNRMRELRVYDNQLMKAEALARTGAVGDAAAILNNAANPRKERGGLADVASNLDAVLAAIFYERDVELFHNGYLISFCDMRRRDMLQQGSPLHYPVPGAELETLGIENYTFGGYDNFADPGTSSGGDWIKPYYHWLQ